MDTVVPALGPLGPSGCLHLPPELACGASPVRATLAARAWPRRGSARRSLGPHGRAVSSRMPLRARAREHRRTAQLGAVLAAGGPALARLLERTEDALGRGGRGPRRRAWAPRRGHARRRAASACGRCSCSCAAPATGRRLVSAGGGGGAAPHGHPRPRRRAGPRRRCAGAVPRSSPRPAARAATATGDLLFSRAFAELAAHWERGRGRARLSAASSALARGELMQRADAWLGGRGRRALPRALPPEDGEPLRRRACRLGALFGGPPRAIATALGCFGERHRPGVPDARRRARRLGPGGAHGQAARHRPSGRHRHAAADPRAREGPRAARAMARVATDAAARRRRCATGSPPRAHSSECPPPGARARGRRRSQAPRPDSGLLRRSARTGAPAWSPTASSSATREGASP